MLRVLLFYHWQDLGHVLIPNEGSVLLKAPGFSITEEWGDVFKRSLDCIRKKKKNNSEQAEYQMSYINYTFSKSTEV